MMEIENSVNSKDSYQKRDKFMEWLPWDSNDQN